MPIPNRRARHRLAMVLPAAALIGPTLALCLTGCNQAPLRADRWLASNEPTAAELAEQAADPRDPDRRRNSLNQLANHPDGRDPEHIAVYHECLDDADPTVRAAAARALGRHGQVDDAAHLAQRLREDPSPLVRWQAAKALQKIHDPAAVRPLLQALADDPNSDVRIAAARALGQYPRPGVFNGLVGGLNDRAFGVVDACRSSLVLLTGQDHGTESRAWLAWAESRDGPLFADGTRYTYRPYQQPQGLLKSMMFWESRDGTAGRQPRGMPRDQPSTEIQSTADNEADAEVAP